MADNKSKTRTVIKFRERPGLRLIQRDDWEQAGVKDHADTLWGPDNDWTVDKADLGLNDEQYARIILADRGFTVETVEASE